MSTVSSAAAHQAAASLTQRDDLPVLLVWSTEDTVFPVEHARRFADQLAHARLVVVRDSYSFIPEDQPGQLAAAIAEFVASR
jgi:pimeloyl-ACP methyl ester carboxylesterase